MKELKELCSRLMVGDILHTDFVIKLSRLVEDMSVDEARELARTVLLKD